MAEKFVMTGLKEVDKALKQLPGVVAKKCVRKGLRKGMKIVLRDAKQNAPTDTGKTKDAIKVRAGRRRRGLITMLVGVSDRDYVGDLYYAAFVELGHKDRNGKFVPPNPFLRNAWALKGTQARDVAIQEILAQVEAEVNKLSK